MPILNISPHSGLLKKLPEHKIAGKKEQYLLEAMNYIDLNGRLMTMPGNERYDSTAKLGLPSWGRRMYYRVGMDDYRHSFVVIGGKMYKSQDSNRTFNQVKIDGNFDTQLDTDSVPMDAAIEISGNIVTYLVDGTYFYKFIPNTEGVWERLPIKTDIDGNTIEPIDICFYQDRFFVLVKKRNIVLFCKNLEPENWNDSTDAGLIQLPAGNGGYPTKLFVHRGFLHVIHDDYFTPISGNSALTYGVNPGDVVYGFGSRAPLSVISLKKYFGFLNSDDNEYYLSGGTLDSTTQSPLSDPIGLRNLINPTKAHLTAATFDPNINCIRIGYTPYGEAVNNSEAIYSFEEKKWAGETYGKKIARYFVQDGPGDNSEVMTLRSDTGLVMFEGRGLNLDATTTPNSGSPQRYRFVTGDYAEDYIHDLQFTEFFIDAKPYGTLTKLPLAYYLDARITARGLEQVTLQGEVINLGLIEIGEQNVYFDRIMPLIDRSKGRMIRFESDETVSNASREIYSISCAYNKQNTRVTKWTVGA